MQTAREVNPYEAPPSEVTHGPAPAWSRAYGSWAWEAAIAGLLIALYDIHSGSGDTMPVFWAYLVAGVILGLRHALWAWLGWVLLGLSLYIVHLAAIAADYKPPFVEQNYEVAQNCLIVLFPAGFGALFGSLVRLGLVALSRLGWLGRLGRPERVRERRGPDTL